MTPFPVLFYGLKSGVFDKLSIFNAAPMSEEGQDVLVLSPHDINDSTSIVSCGQTTTTNVLNKLLTGSNSSGTSASNTYILYIPGFRKIEPKPGLELRSDEVVEEKESPVKENKAVTPGRSVKQALVV